MVRKLAASFVRSRSGSMFAAAISLFCALTPAHAISVAGTICYRGAEGPVTTDRPIVLVVFYVLNDEHLSVTAIVPSTCGDFSLPVPEPGDYNLAYGLDSWPQGGKSVGKPFQFYNHKFTRSDLDPLRVPQSGITGLTLEFDDTGIISGIQGYVTYTGSRGLVHGYSAPLSVLACADPTCSSGPIIQSSDIGSNGGPFGLLFLSSGVAYYPLAFFDLNHNGTLDMGEPFGTCASPIAAGPHQTGVMITFGDQGTATCVVLPPSPPALCGDCNGDGTVTANEITQTISNIFKNGAGLPPQ